MLSTGFNRRQVLKGLLAAGGATVITACGATATTAPAAEATAAPAEEVAEATIAATEAAKPAPGEAVTLRYRSWHSPESSPSDQAWYEWLTENYKTDHPEATIEYEFVSWGDEYIQKVLADCAAGDPPDALHSSIVWARDFYDRGVLLDLNDYIDQVPELSADQFFGEATNEYRSKDGKYYGVPWEGPDSSVMAINSRLFEEAGFDPKGADITTWEDFIKVAQAITKLEGDKMVQAGFLVESMASIESFATWMYTQDGSCSDDAFTKPTFNNTKGAEVMQLQLDLLNEYKVSLPISAERQDTQLFMQDKVGMVHWGTWASASIIGNAPEDFAWWLIPFPQGPQGDSMATTCWSNMFVQPKDTANPEASFELIRYCATPPVVVTRFELSTRTTPHKAIFESDAWKKVLETVPQREVTTSAAELGGIYPYFPFFTEAQDALGTVLEQIMLGEKGVEEGLAEAETAVAKVMDRRNA